MSKVRINDLARELEVKSKAILDVLTEVGVTEKKTHSSSIEDHEAEKVRAHIRGSAEAQSSSARNARPLRGEPGQVVGPHLVHRNQHGQRDRRPTRGGAGRSGLTGERPSQNRHECRPRHEDA